MCKNIIRTQANTNTKLYDQTLEKTLRLRYAQIFCELSISITIGITRRNAKYLQKQQKLQSSALPRPGQPLFLELDDAFAVISEVVARPSALASANVILWVTSFFCLTPRRKGAKNPPANRAQFRTLKRRRRARYKTTPEHYDRVASRALLQTRRVQRRVVEKK